MMNSNLINSKPRLSLPAYIDLGMRFGVRDSTGAVYSNIKDYFLLSKLLRITDLERGTIEAPNKSSSIYQLTVDRKLKEKILRNGLAMAIISFQRKTEGCFAVARLFETNRTGFITKREENDNPKI